MTEAIIVVVLKWLKIVEAISYLPLIEQKFQQM